MADPTNKCCPGSGVECGVTQILDYSDPVLTVTSSGAVDLTLDESGSTGIAPGQSEVDVTFEIPKAGDYRFEFLYVDAFGVVNPGTIHPVPVTQSKTGFVVQIAGMPPVSGYVLRWRVVVFQVTGETPPVPDPPESIYIPIPEGSTFLIVHFAVPRTGLDYGFDELRVERIVPPGPPTDPLEIQVISPMIISKLFSQFTVKFSAAIPDEFYFLAARTP